MINKKLDDYTCKIYNQLAQTFNSDCENFIGADELSEGDNATTFIHAITQASALLYSKLTNDEVDLLGFNHIQNRLIVQHIK